MGSAFAAKAEEKKKTPAPSAPAGEVLQLKSSCGAAAGLPKFLQVGCGCDDCRSALQAKLVLDGAGNGFEGEADRIAEAASQPDGTKPEIKPTPLGISRSHSSAIPAADGGSPLDPHIRDRVEPVVGASLGHLRVHTSAADREVAKDLHAKAFTHGSHIWLGPAQSSTDAKLMAHEAAHVVQQGAGGRPSIQRLADDSAAGATSSAFVRDALKDVPVAQDGAGERDQSKAGTREKADPKEYAHKKAELRAKGQPVINHATREKPKLDRAAEGAKKEAQKPAEPHKAGKDAKGGKEDAAKSGQKKKDTGAEKRSAKRPGPGGRLPASPFRAPVAPPQVQLPQIAPPKDSAGKPLRPDPRGDVQILGLAAMAQAMRMQGAVLQQRAAQERHNASILQENMDRVHEGTSHADDGLAKSEDHLAYRREVVGQTTAALAMSEQKAEMVASGAPKYSAKSAEGKEKSGPMSSEAKGLAAQNTEQTPDDDDAAEKSHEQGQKINKVGSDIASMDDAITQTKSKADGLSQEAAQAKETNAKTRQDIAGTGATLDQTHAHLSQLSQRNAGAKQRLAGLASGPGEVLAGAVALDEQGAAAIRASIRMEQRVHSAQQRYQQGMGSVPASKRAGDRQASAAPAVVQRQAEPGGEPKRIDLNLGAGAVEALPSWLTGEEKQSEEERAAAQAAETKRRADEIKEINDEAKGNFANLDAADKAGIVLSLTARHIFGDVSSIKWPDMLGKVAQGLVDPRMALMGIVSGLSMTLSGAANLLSIEQWKRDPLGNLLKSAADIATGITIILGSITALAMAIIAILVLAAIFSFGALGPVAAAVIPFCSTVVATVGPWTIEAAAIALDLNILVLIKDLVAAATAKTAADLQSQSDKVTADAKNAGNMALQIGMAAVGEAGGKALMSTEFGQSLAAGARQIGEDFNIVKPGVGAAPVVPEGAAVEPTATPPPEGAAAPKPDVAPPGGDTVPPAEAAGPKPDVATPEGHPPPEATAPGEPPKPALDEHIVAEQPTADGHTVKVNEQGECLVCTECENVTDAVEKELAGENVDPQKKAALEAKAEAVNEIADPEAKAEAGKEVRAEAQEAAEEAKPSEEKSPQDEVPPEEEKPTQEELKKRADVKKLLKRVQEKGLPGTEQQYLDYIADAPEARIAEINKAIDLREVTSGTQTGVPVENRENLPIYGDQPPSLEGGLDDRLEEVHGAMLDPFAEGQRTTAILTTHEGPNIVGAGAEQDLTPAQRATLVPGEVPARLPGEHAEITTLAEADARGLSPSELLASRDFCDGCLAEIERRGGTVINPRRAVFPPRQ